MQYFVVTTNLY